MNLLILVYSTVLSQFVDKANFKRKRAVTCICPRTDPVMKLFSGHNNHKWKMCVLSRGSLKKTVFKADYSPLSNS